MAAIIQIEADGSAKADRHPTVTIDYENPADRWQWRCPNGHRGKSWEPTNSHVYCYGCRRQRDTGNDIEVEHYHLVHVKTGEEIPYSAIEFKNA